jgi:spoIIIJ-associated protein
VSSDSSPVEDVVDETGPADEIEAVEEVDLAEELDSDGEQGEDQQGDDEDGDDADPDEDVRVKDLEQEGDIAADYLEELLDIADLDGDLDIDVEGDRAARRRGARRPPGADPARGLSRDGGSVPADAGRLRLPG